MCVCHCCVSREYNNAISSGISFEGLFIPNASDSSKDSKRLEDIIG